MLGGSRPFSGSRRDAGAGRKAAPPPRLTKWLRDVGSKYKGTKIRFVSEATPPTVVAKLAGQGRIHGQYRHRGRRRDHAAEQVLQKVTVDAQGKLGAYDLYYMDQSWTSLFVGDTVDPREHYERKTRSGAAGFRLERLLQASDARHLDLQGHAGRHPVRRSDLHPDVPQGSVREAPAEGADDDGRVHDRREDARRGGARQRHPRHDRPAEGRPLFADLRLDHVALGQWRLGVRQGRLLLRRRRGRPARPRLHARPRQAYAAGGEGLDLGRRGAVAARGQGGDGAYRGASSSPASMARTPRWSA